MSSLTLSLPTPSRTVRACGFAALLCGWLGQASAQDPAFAGSLSQYLELTESVTIGEAHFSEFQLLPLQEGASEFFTDFIDLIPITDAGTPGFRVEVMDGATAEDFFQLRFSFRVSGVFANGATLSLSEATVQGSSNGGVDTLIDISSGGERVASLLSFVAPGGIKKEDTASNFAPVTNFIVDFDTVIDGGNDASAAGIVASLGAVTLQLSETVAPSPIIVRDSGLLDSTTFYIDFTAAPMTSHSLKSSPDLRGNFSTLITPISGSTTTDSQGVGRVEFDIASLGAKQFFRIERSL